MVGLMKDNILSQLDPNIIYVCVGIMVVTLIIAIIKRAVKIALVITVVSVLVYSLAPMASEYQDKFSIHVGEGNVLEMNIDGHEYKVGGEDSGIKSTEFERLSDGNYNLKIMFQNGEIQYIEVPGFMRDAVVKYFDTNEITNKLIE